MRIGIYSYNILDLLTGPGDQGTGGAEMQLATLGRRLQERGHEVIWLVGDVFPEVEKVVGEYRFVKLFDQHHRGPLSRLGYFWKSITRAKPEVVVERGSSRTTFWLALFCRLTGRRFVFLGASDVNFVRQAVDPNFTTSSSHVLYRLGLRLASAIGAQKESQRKLLFDGFRRDAVLVRNFPPNVPGRDDHDVERSDVLWVSNLLPYKQPDVFLRMARRLPEVRFAMIGGARDLRYYEVIREEAARLPNLRFHGFVPPSVVAGHIAASKILVNTTMVANGYEEGFPNAFLQAWSAGVPVISLLSNPDGVITALGLGLCVPDEDAMTESILRLLHDDVEREAMGMRGREYVRTQHDPEEILRAYQTLLGIPARGMQSGVAEN